MLIKQEHRNLKDSLKVSHTFFYYENGYKKNFTIEFYKKKTRFLSLWYFIFSELENDGKSLGPFLTKFGSKRYAKKLIKRKKF